MKVAALTPFPFLLMIGFPFQSTYTLWEAMDEDNTIIFSPFFIAMLASYGLQSWLKYKKIIISMLGAPNLLKKSIKLNPDRQIDNTYLPTIFTRVVVPREFFYLK